jgi:HSP20 family protein
MQVRFVVTRRTEPMANLISRPLWDLRRDIDQLFDSLFGGASTSAHGPSPEEFRPKLDVVELDSEYKLCAELPGMRSEDVEVRLEEGMLTIRGEKRREEHKAARGLEYVERSYGSFARSIQLPPGIDLGRIKAKFEQGVLIVTIPKGAGAHARKIPIAPEAGKLEGDSSHAISTPGSTPPEATLASSKESASGLPKGGAEGPEPPDAEDREPVETG